MDILKQVIVMLLTLVKKEQAKQLGDKLLDTLEDFVKDTENKVDDAIVLPLILKAREILDIPDGND